MQSHQKWMVHAIELARENKKFPFASVVVRDQDQHLVGEGINKSHINPTWHGEMIAINSVVARYGKTAIDWSGLTLYTTAEPCPMCASAMLWSGIGHVVWGTSIETLLQNGWKQIQIPCPEIAQMGQALSSLKMSGGVCKAQCDALFTHAPI